MYGLKDMFHFSEYIDDHGMVSHAVTLDHGDCGSLIEERHITCIPHLHTVSYVVPIFSNFIYKEVSIVLKIYRD